MPYQKLGKIPQGKSSRQGPSFYGDGRDGDLSTTGNTNAPNSSTDDSSSCISQFSSLTVNSGHTLTLTGRRRAWVIYCVGDMNIQGSIVMNKGAAAAASVINLTRYDVNGLTGSSEPANTVVFTTPAAGAAGGALRSTDGDGNTGTAGTAGGTGGGGGGSNATTVPRIGGAGGSGIVVISYPDVYSDLTTIDAGLTYTKTTYTGYKVYTFTSGTGTVTV